MKKMKITVVLIHWFQICFLILTKKMTFAVVLSFPKWDLLKLKTIKSVLKELLMIQVTNF